MSKRTLWRRLGSALALGAVLLAGSAAQAGEIFSSSELIQGTSVVSSIAYTFSVSGPGVLTVDLADMAWPSKLSDLTFTATTPLSLIGEFSGSGVESFNVTAGGTIYAYVTGEATNPASGPGYGVGLFTLSVDFTPTAPVPLPATLSLLLATLLGLALLQLRTHRDYRFLSAPPQSA